MHNNKNEVDNKLQDLVLDSAGTDFITNYYDKNYIDTHYYTTDNTYTKSEIEDKLNNLEIGSTNIDLSNYYTKSEINNAAYLQSFTESDPIFTASAAAEITSSDITNWNNKLESSSLNNYYTKTEINNAGYLTSHQTLKTINNQSLIGSGNITIQNGSNNITVMSYADYIDPNFTPDENQIYLCF